MPELIFYGASDDLFEVEGVVSEEFPVPMDPETVTVLVVCPDGRRAKVRGTYEPNGCWSIAVIPADEDVDAPEGRIEVSGYTTRLILDVPERTTVHALEQKDR